MMPSPPTVTEALSSTILLKEHSLAGLDSFIEKCKTIANPDHTSLPLSLLNDLVTENIDPLSCTWFEWMHLYLSRNMSWGHMILTPDIRKAYDTTSRPTPCHVAVFTLLLACLSENVSLDDADIPTLFSKYSLGSYKGLLTTVSIIKTVRRTVWTTFFCACLLLFCTYLTHCYGDSIYCSISFMIWLILVSFILYDGIQTFQLDIFM